MMKRRKDVCVFVLASAQEYACALACLCLRYFRLTCTPSTPCARMLSIQLDMLLNDDRSTVSYTKIMT